MDISSLFSRFFPAHVPIPPGNYRGNLYTQSSLPNKAHLRVEKDGNGILILNGSLVVHLNQTAAELAYYLIQNIPLEKISKNIRKRYGVSQEQSVADIQKFISQIDTLLNIPDLDPVAYLGIERTEVNAGAISAPYRLDCALTYRHPDNSFLRSAPVERVKSELRTEEWESILRKASDAGIPHVIFTGGEPTLREDLSALIHFSSQLGMITGLLTTGCTFNESNISQLINECGLDHIMLIFSETDHGIWNTLRFLIEQDIFLTVHLTITSRNRPQYIEWIENLQNLGVKNLSLSTNAFELKDEVLWARNKISEMGFRLVWDIPVPYSHLHPVSLEIALSEESNTFTRYPSLYVEPDGDVLPAQGDFQILGNLLHDSWESIWNAALERRKVTRGVS